MHKSLHWHTVRRVIYKTALVAYKTLKTEQPVNLCDLLHHHQPARTLRSSSQLLLYQPATRINFQSKAFSITAPAVWNSLSPVTKSSATITNFKAQLKNELFAAAYDISSAAGASDSNSRHAVLPICFWHWYWYWQCYGKHKSAANNIEYHKLSSPQCHSGNPTESLPRDWLFIFRNVKWRKKVVNTKKDVRELT